jgi:hypothetical protein
MKFKEEVNAKLNSIKALSKSIKKDLKNTETSANRTKIDLASLQQGEEYFIAYEDEVGHYRFYFGACKFLYRSEKRTSKGWIKSSIKFRNSEGEKISFGDSMQEKLTFFKTKKEAEMFCIVKNLHEAWISMYTAEAFSLQVRKKWKEDRSDT